MPKQLNLYEQRKKLNNIYNNIIKRKDLPECEFDHLMRLWIIENEKLEEKELLLEINFLHQKNIKTNINNYLSVN